MAVTTTQPAGTLPPEQSFFSTQEDNVVITAIKKDEDDNSLIVRFYEWAGKKGDMHLTLPDKATSASATNLMETVAEHAHPRLKRQSRHRPNQCLRNQDSEGAIRKTLKPFPPRIPLGGDGLHG